MNSGSGQDGSSQRGSGQAVPHRSGHRHSLSSSKTTNDERSDADRIRPSISAPSQNTSNNVAPGSGTPSSKPRIATARKHTKPVARKSTGMLPPSRTSRITPNKPEPAIEIPDSEDSDPAPLEELRRRSDQKRRSHHSSQTTLASRGWAAATTSSSQGHRPTKFTSTSTQRTPLVRPRTLSKTFTKDQRAKLKRPGTLPRRDRNEPPPPGAEVVEISSDDEQPANTSTVSPVSVSAPAQRAGASSSGPRTSRPGQVSLPETIDLTMDDEGDDGVPDAFVSASAAASASGSTAAAINKPPSAPLFTPITLDPKPSPVRHHSVTQVGVPPPPLPSPSLNSTQIPFRGGSATNLKWVLPGSALDAPPSTAVTTPSPSTAPGSSSVAVPRLIPRRSILGNSPFPTRSSLPPTSLTNRRTPVSPSVFAATLPSHRLSPAPVRASSPLAVEMGWHRTAQEALDTPIEEEGYSLDVDMGDDGHVDNSGTAWSTPLQEPMTDDERPPPVTPGGEDMELDVTVPKEGDVSLSAVPVQALAHIPAPIPGVVTPRLVSFLSRPSRPLASAPPEDSRPVIADVVPQSPVVRSRSLPNFSKPGREVTPAPALHPLSTDAADESDVVEGTDITMGTSSEDEQVSPEFHTTALPRPYSGFELSDDEFAGGVASGHSSISAPMSDDEVIAPADTAEPEDPTEGLTDFAKEIYADILEKNPNEAAYYARMARKYPGEKLDTRVVDMMNALPGPWKQDVTTKISFESYIMSAVSAYNPWSPPIKVINTIDAQPNPPWEFMYTERMVYGNGVKKPTREERRARGCECYPYCKPNDRGCACLKRQEKYGKEVDLKGFRYNRDGLLTFTDTVPIFECADGCRCNEDCPNRVAQYGRTKKLALEKTVNKGWGVVAMERIPAGSFLGIYSGELLLPCELEVREAFYNTYGRTYTFEMDFHYLKERGRKRGKKTSAKYSIDAFHAGCFTRYLNHSCYPNCVIIPVIYGEATADTPYLGFYTRSHVEEGEDLEFSYKGVPDEEQLTDLARAARFRKKKERAIAEGQKFDTTSALCRCGAKNCDGSMWRWEQEKDEDDGGDSSDGTEMNEKDGERRIQDIGVLDDPDDGEYEGSDDELDQLESDDEGPPRIEMV